MKKNNDLGLLIIRISIGLLMLLHGISKLIFGIDFIKGMLSGMGLPEFFAYGVLVGEVLAPIFLLAGYRARIAAAIYSINCIVAMLMAHSGDFFSLNDYGGWAVELLGLYLFGAVAIFFTGAGKFAVSKSNKWD